MDNMPVRIVFTKTVEKGNEYYEIGTIKDIDKSKFSEFENDYSGYFTILERREEDWFNLAYDNFVNSYSKYRKLKAVEDYYKMRINRNELIDKLEHDVPKNGTDVDLRRYSGGLREFYIKSSLYAYYINQYEKDIDKGLVNYEKTSRLFF